MPQPIGKPPTQCICLVLTQRVLVFILANVKVQVESPGDAHTVTSTQTFQEDSGVFFVGWS